MASPKPEITGKDIPPPVEPPKDREPDKTGEKPKSTAPELGKTADEVGTTLTGNEISQALSKRLVEHEDKTATDRGTLKKKDIKTIRYTHQVLKEEGSNIKDPVKKMENLKEETARRIQAYTTGKPDAEGWFELDYMSVGGVSHEYGIGLGDILLDVDIKEIEILRSGEETPVRGTRKIVPSGKHKGRIGFVDESGNYLATLTHDRFRILSTTERKEDQAAEYAKEIAVDKKIRDDHKKVFEDQNVSYGKYADRDKGFERRISRETADTYKAKRAEIKEKLDPHQISEIPYTRSTEEIPAKAAGTVRLVVFGDTNGGYGKSGQQYLDQLQQILPSWSPDLVMGMGDHISAGGKKVTDERYQQLAEEVRQDFAKFETPYAIASGNHDVNKHGQSIDFTALFKDKLREQFHYQEKLNEKGEVVCYSINLGKGTFIVFNEKTASTITREQIDFFKEVSVKSEGAVYLVSHIPPYQHAYGSGLKADGSGKLSGFEEIQQFAKEHIEKPDGKGHPFYVLSGHDHFSTVIGNMINPGGMASAYSGNPDGTLTSVPSCAVIDIEEATGKIKAVYFRSARSGFTSDLPAPLHAAAWGKEDLMENFIQKKNPFLEGSIVGKIRIDLNEDQRQNAEIIEREFRAANVPEKVIAAALANAYHESKLSAEVDTGDSGKSIGLFQLYENGAGHGMTVAERQDPVINTRTILKRGLFGRKGSKVLEAERQGASVADLAVMFSRYVEVAAHPENLRATAEKLFGEDALA